jgi:hypothetical protein
MSIEMKKFNKFNDFDEELFMYFNTVINTLGDLEEGTWEECFKILDEDYNDKEDNEIFDKYILPNLKDKDITDDDKLEMKMYFSTFLSSLGNGDSFTTVIKIIKLIQEQKDKDENYKNFGEKYSNLMFDVDEYGNKDLNESFFYVNLSQNNNYLAILATEQWNRNQYNKIVKELITNNVDGVTEKFYMCEVFNGASQLFDNTDDKGPADITLPDPSDEENADCHGMFSPGYNPYG